MSFPSLPTHYKHAHTLLHIRSYTSLNTNRLHIYNGSVRLSFWSDSASNTAEIAAMMVYRTVWEGGISGRNVVFGGEMLTENGSAIPKSRSSQAARTTEDAKAAVPSVVFGVRGVQRWIPMRLPTMDA